MAGAWISAWSATSLRRVPAYPFRLSTCAAASRIRSLVRADLEPASSGAVTSGFLGTSRIIGVRLSRPSARPARRGAPAPRSRCSSPVLATRRKRWPTPATPSGKASFYPEVERIRASLIRRLFVAFRLGPERKGPLTPEARLRLGSISQTLSGGPAEDHVPRNVRGRGAGPGRGGHGGHGRDAQLR